MTTQRIALRSALSTNVNAELLGKCLPPKQAGSHTKDYLFLLIDVSLKLEPR